MSSKIAFQKKSPNKSQFFSFLCFLFCFIICFLNYIHKVRNFSFVYPHKISAFIFRDFYVLWLSIVYSHFWKDIELIIVLCLHVCCMYLSVCRHTCRGTCVEVRGWHRVLVLTSHFIWDEVSLLSTSVYADQLRIPGSFCVHPAVYHRRIGVTDATRGHTRALGILTQAFMLTWLVRYQLNHLSSPNWLFLGARMPSLL